MVFCFWGPLKIGRFVICYFEMTMPEVAKPLSVDRGEEKVVWATLGEDRECDIFPRNPELCQAEFRKNTKKTISCRIAARIIIELVVNARIVYSVPTPICINKRVSTDISLGNLIIRKILSWPNVPPCAQNRFHNFNAFNASRRSLLSCCHSLHFASWPTFQLGDFGETKSIASTWQPCRSTICFLS